MFQSLCKKAGQVLDPEDLAIRDGALEERRGPESKVGGNDFSYFSSAALGGPRLRKSQHWYLKHCVEIKKPPQLLSQKVFTAALSHSS